MSDIVNKLWGFCHTLRHDGVDYGDYIEQLTYLLFLKMADERGVEVPKKYNWNSLKTERGTDLTDHYQEVLRKLREEKGILGKIFTQAMPRINNPVNLKRLVNMIDEEDWYCLISFLCYFGVVTNFNCGSLLMASTFFDWETFA